MLYICNCNRVEGFQPVLPKRIKKVLMRKSYNGYDTFGVYNTCRIVQINIVYVRHIKETVREMIFLYFRSIRFFAVI